MIDHHTRGIVTYVVLVLQPKGLAAGVPCCMDNILAHAVPSCTKDHHRANRRRDSSSASASAGRDRDLRRNDGGADAGQCHRASRQR